LQLPHQVLEPLALGADQVGDRHPAVLEQELRGVRRVHAELLQGPGHLEAGRVALDEERGDARMATGRVGLREDRVQVGDAGVEAARLHERDGIS